MTRVVCHCGLASRSDTNAPSPISKHPRYGLLSSTQLPAHSVRTGSLTCISSSRERSDPALDPEQPRQAHVVKTFGQAWWLSTGIAYSWAGENTIDGVPKGDDKGNLILGASFGFRLADAQSVRLAYVRSDTQNDVGQDTDSLYVGWSIRF